MLVLGEKKNENAEQLQVTAEEPGHNILSGLASSKPLRLQLRLLAC